MNRYIIYSSAGHDTHKIYNRYNYNYILFSYNRTYYKYFTKIYDDANDKSFSVPAFISSEIIL